MGNMAESDTFYNCRGDKSTISKHIKNLFNEMNRCIKWHLKPTANQGADFLG